jgi:hypothetical protein
MEKIYVDSDLKLVAEYSDGSKFIVDLKSSFSGAIFYPQNSINDKNGWSGKYYPNQVIYSASGISPTGTKLTGYVTTITIPESLAINTPMKEWFLNSCALVFNSIDKMEMI